MAFEFGIFGETVLTDVTGGLDTAATEEVNATLDFFANFHIPLAIISSAPKDSIERLRELGIVDRFEAVILDAEDKEQLILQMVRRHPGLEDLRPQDVFFVDTTPDGIAQAKGAGVVPFALSAERDLPPEMKGAGAQWHVRSWRDLRNVISANNN